ncbi:hypothetical protein ABPG72_005964 [Tetrahymena utriculariae]
MPSFFVALQKCAQLDNLILYISLEKSSQQDAFRIGQTISEYLNIKSLELWFEGNDNLHNLITGLSSSNSILSLSLWLESEQVQKDSYIQNIAAGLLKFKRLYNIKIPSYDEQEVNRLFKKLRKLKRLINFDQEIL